MGVEVQPGIGLASVVLVVLQHVDWHPQRSRDLIRFKRDCEERGVGIGRKLDKECGRQNGASPGVRESL